MVSQIFIGIFVTAFFIIVFQEIEKYFRFNKLKSLNLIISWSDFKIEHLKFKKIFIVTKLGKTEIWASRDEFYSTDWDSGGPNNSLAIYPTPNIRIIREFSKENQIKIEMVMVRVHRRFLNPKHKGKNENQI
ncbi:MAG: hypothetical protein WA705_13760 [Candidatus Ozemobacteraceae bacterium]